MITRVTIRGIVATLGIWIDAPKASAEPIVFIVCYHNVDYAKTVCDYVLRMQKSGLDVNNDAGKGAAECRSVQDARQLGRRVENDLINALAIEPLCAGVTVIRDPQPEFDGGGFSKANSDIRKAKPYWDVTSNISPARRCSDGHCSPTKQG